MFFLLIVLTPCSYPTLDLTCDDTRLKRLFFSVKRLFSQVSGRLFNQSSDSVPRRSARLSRDTTINSNSNISQFGGNGTDHSSGKLRVNSSTPSKLCSTALRSVQVRKGKPQATENFDEGDYHFDMDDSLNYISLKLYKPRKKCGWYVVIDTAIRIYLHVCLYVHVQWVHISKTHSSILYWLYLKSTIMTPSHNSQGI